MQHRIIGSTLPVLEMTLSPGESVIAVSGELSWMGSSIQLKTFTGLASGGGFMNVLKRVAGGGSLFMTEYSASGAPGILAFATRVPGHILPVTLNQGRVEYFVHRHGFLCGERGVEVSLGFQRSLGAGIFGGDGFILQKLAGHGQAFVELDGEVVPYELGPGETLRVHPGHVGMFEATVNFDITRIAGVRNMLFGGDGIFLAALTGPGKVWLQSLPLSNLAHALRPYLGESVGESATSAGVGGLIGSVVRGVLSSK